MDEELSSACVEKREESQGGANASRAIAVDTAAAGIHSRRRSGRVPAVAAPAASSRKNGSPTAGMVQFQSPEACTIQYADAANAAGMSRRYGGIHFAQGDLTGHVLGAVRGDGN